MCRTTLPRSGTRRTVAALCLSFALLLASAAPAAGCEWDYPVWIPRERDADPLYRFIRGGKAGYIDRTGKIVIEPKFSFYGNYAGTFHDGLLEVGASSGEYVDATGATVVKDKLYRGWQFSEGLAAALEARFEMARDFSEGLAPVMRGGKWGFIDKTGRVVIEPRFDDAKPFSGGLAVVRQGGLDGYVDARGTLVIPPRYGHADDFAEGLAPVGRWDEESDQGDFHYIDRSGRTVIPGPFRLASHFFKGPAHVRLKPVKQGERVARFAYIDAKGKTIFAYEVETDED